MKKKYKYPFRKRKHYIICGVIVIVGNGLGNLNTNLDKAVCISYSANTLRKGINPTILPPVMSK